MIWEKGLSRHMHTFCSECLLGKNVYMSAGSSSGALTIWQLPRSRKECRLLDIQSIPSPSTCSTSSARNFWSSVYLWDRCPLQYSFCIPAACGEIQTQQEQPFLQLWLDCPLPVPYLRFSSILHRDKHKAGTLFLPPETLIRKAWDTSGGMSRCCQPWRSLDVPFKGD